MLCSPTLRALAALVLIAAVSEAASSARHVESPFPLLPDYIEAARTEVRALERVRRAPRAALGKCLGDLWWGIKDSVQDTVQIAGSCVSETVDEVKFFWEDTRQFGAKVVGELKDAIGKCSHSRPGCASLVLAVVRRELRPAALLVAQALRLFIRVGYSGLFGLLGCSFLPALMPLVWNTLMDVIIFGQCLLQK